MPRGAPPYPSGAATPWPAGSSTAWPCPAAARSARGRAVEVVPLYAEPRMAVVSAADDRSDAAYLDMGDLLTLPERARREPIDPDWEGSSP